MKEVIVLLLLLGVVLSVTSCNMIRGAGQDIENAGGAVKDATR